MKKYVMVLMCAFLLGGCAAQTSSALRDNVARTFPGSVDDVHRASVATLMDLGWRVTSSSRADGLIQAVTPISLWTYGDQVTVHVMPVGSGVRVDITSGSSRQLYDWGKNTENIERFYARLAESLSKR